MKFKQEFLTRQADIIPVEKQGISIAIVGAGAIGSFVTLSLAKMGYGNIKVFDFDEISTENMNCQFYRTKDIGKKKVDALKELVYDFTGFDITIVDTKIQASDIISADIIISAVDSMEARKIIAKSAACKYLIDPRMGAEYAIMEVMPSIAIQKYVSNLYTDSEAAHVRCTAKATMYTVNLIAGQVAKAVKDITLDEPYIKSLEWNINKNTSISFNSEGERL